MAPQMVHPNPTQALARVRSVPRGRVPIFLVGDSADEPRMAGLADGFFIRPVAPDELLDRARAVLTASGTDGSNGARRRTTTGENAATTASEEFAQGTRTPRGGPHLGRPAVLKPLKARAAANAPRVPPIPHPAGDASALLAKLSAGIDDLFEADLSRALASAPRTRTAPEGEREFDDMPTDDRRQRSASNEREALLARYALVEEGDYFEILGIGRDASTDEIQRAHDRIARQLAAERDRAGAGHRAGREARRDPRGRRARRCACSPTARSGRVTPSTCREDLSDGRASGGVLRLARVRGAVVARGRR